LTSTSIRKLFHFPHQVPDCNYIISPTISTALLLREYYYFICFMNGNAEKVNRGNVTIIATFRRTFASPSLSSPFLKTLLSAHACKHFFSYLTME
jgi:hypothetical protein